MLKKVDLLQLYWSAIAAIFDMVYFLLVYFDTKNKLVLNGYIYFKKLYYKQIPVNFRHSQHITKYILI